jgi:pimeloyl-ACP methyl ester carboxylesterase
MWAKQTAALTDFHCVKVDLPGHGKSNGVVWISLADTAVKIREIIRQNAMNGRAHIVGLSLGGQVALVMLERHAHVLDRVILSGVTAAPMPNRALLQPYLWLMSAIMKRRWFANQQAKSLPLAPDEQQALIANLQAMSMQAYRRIWKEVVDYSLSPALRDVTTPTLVTAGGKETSIILQAVETIAQLMPNAQGRLAPGLGHGWNVEAPALFNAMIRAWIAGASLPERLVPVSAHRTVVR